MELSEQTAVISISKLVGNTGQIEGLPKNPRVIRNEAFERLKENIRQYPGMLSHRDLSVYPYGDKYVVVCGNQRLAALRDLGFKECPVTIIPEGTPAKKLRAYAYKDNLEYGRWNMDDIANEWADMMDLEALGIDLSCWQPKEQDLYSNSGEIDVEEFAETIELKLTLTHTEAEWLKAKLKEYHQDPAKAILMVIDGGYEEGGAV